MTRLLRSDMDAEGECQPTGAQPEPDDEDGCHMCDWAISLISTVDGGAITEDNRQTAEWKQAARQWLNEVRRDKSAPAPQPEGGEVERVAFTVAALECEVAYFDRYENPDVPFDVRGFRDGAISSLEAKRASLARRILAAEAAQ